MNDEMSVACYNNLHHRHYSHVDTLVIRISDGSQLLVSELATDG